MIIPSEIQGLRANDGKYTIVAAAVGEGAHVVALVHDYLAAS
jgi:hypothetical protein